MKLNEEQVKAIGPSITGQLYYAITNLAFKFAIERGVDPKTSEGVAVITAATNLACGALFVKTSLFSNTDPLINMLDIASGGLADQLAQLRTTDAHVAREARALAEARNFPFDDMSDPVSSSALQ